MATTHETMTLTDSPDCWQAELVHPKYPEVLTGLSGPIILTNNEGKRRRRKKKRSRKRSADLSAATTTTAVAAAAAAAVVAAATAITTAATVAAINAPVPSVASIESSPAYSSSSSSSTQGRSSEGENNTTSRPSTPSSLLSPILSPTLSPVLVDELDFNSPNGRVLVKARKRNDIPTPSFGRMTDRLKQQTCGSINRIHLMDERTDLLDVANEEEEEKEEEEEEEKKKKKVKNEMENERKEMEESYHSPKSDDGSDDTVVVVVNGTEEPFFDTDHTLSPDSPLTPSEPLAYLKTTTTVSIQEEKKYGSEKGFMLVTDEMKSNITTLVQQEHDDKFSDDEYEVDEEYDAYKDEERLLGEMNDVLPELLTLTAATQMKPGSHSYRSDSFSASSEKRRQNGETGIAKTVFDTFGTDDDFLNKEDTTRVKYKRDEINEYEFGFETNVESEWNGSWEFERLRTDYLARQNRMLESELEHARQTAVALRDIIRNQEYRLYEAARTNEELTNRIRQLEQKVSRELIDLQVRRRSSIVASPRKRQPTLAKRNVEDAAELRRRCERLAQEAKCREEETEQLCDASEHTTKPRDLSAVWRDVASAAGIQVKKVDQEKSIPKFGEVFAAAAGLTTTAK